MSLHTIAPDDAEAATREFVDMVTEDRDWRQNYYGPDETDTDQVPTCDPTEYCGRCRPCHVLAFFTKAWEQPIALPSIQHPAGAQRIDIAA